MKDREESIMTQDFFLEPPEEIEMPFTEMEKTIGGDSLEEEIRYN